jgi:hypothetical protein
MLIVNSCIFRYQDAFLRELTKDHNLYNILCTVNTQHTSNKMQYLQLRDVWLHVSVVTGHLQANSEQQLRYSTLIVVLSWPENGRPRPKHVAKHHLIVIIASFLCMLCIDCA